MKVYLDANATSALRPSALEAIAAFCVSESGNPSSVHGPGRQARKLLTAARRDVSRLLSLGKTEELDIVFTSGGTEAANFLISGFVRGPKAHLVSSAIEHAAVREAVEKLVAGGCTASWVQPGSDGIVRADDFVRELRPETALVTLMAANNETGAVQPVVELAKVLRGAGFSGVIVSDFTQVPGKFALPVCDLFDAGVDAVSISAHKLGAPAGCGAVVFAPNPSVCRMLSPMILGGAQEGRRRGGTENLLGIAALGAVCCDVFDNLQREISEVRERRNLLRALLDDRVSDLLWLTPEDHSALSNTLSVRASGCRADDLVVALDLRGIAISVGAACSSGKQEVSHVAIAQLRDKQAASEVVRISIDWCTTEEQIRFAAQTIGEVIHGMRCARAA